MVVSRWSWVISTVLLGSGIGSVSSDAWAQAKPDGPPALEGPVLGEPPTPDVPDAQAQPGEPVISAPLHDALRLTEGRAKPERAPKSPPPPVAERPSTDRPDPQARWFGGYWSWDPTRNDFVWVSGAWRVPPAGSIWVEGRWMRDAEGWYRVPGVWSRRQERRDSAVAANADRWRVNGPPADRPAEAPGPAPGPDYFYIPGQYVPEGERAVWKSGYWARVQPGWDWVAARWVRQADGWQYREGYWTRDTGPVLSETRRHNVARPSDLPPAIVESEPAPSTPPAGPENPPATDPDRDRDVIADAEQDTADRVPVVPGVTPPVVIVGPRGRYMPVGPPVVGYGYRTGMPYRMIRPPSPLYGPAGVVVPDAVPPFVQRILNRVLP
jgi:hypothetical protein